MTENETREFKKTTVEISEGIVSIVSILININTENFFLESKKMVLHLNLRLLILF